VSAGRTVRFRLLPEQQQLLPSRRNAQTTVATALITSSIVAAHCALQVNSPSPAPPSTNEPSLPVVKTDISSAKTRPKTGFAQGLPPC
jgi:hypothetical protein